MPATRTAPAWHLSEPAALAQADTSAEYAMYGVRVLCDIPLPVARSRAADPAPPTWTIRCQPRTPSLPLPACAPLDDHRAPDGTPIDRFYRSGDEAWLWDREAGLFHLEPAAGRVTFTPLPHADFDDVGLLIIGPVSAFLLQQAGHPTLHASAVVTEYGACAFMAPSTFGKSTLAAGLLHVGARLLTDDLLPLEIRSDAVYGLPGAPMMKLWQNTAAETLGIPDDLPQLSSLTEKRLLTLERHAFPFHEDAAVLRAIYLPCRYDPAGEGTSAVRVEPLSPREAVLALLSQTYRGHYLYPQELAMLLQQYGQLVTQARVARLHLPAGLEYRDAVTERILTDLSSLGDLEAS